MKKKLLITLTLIGLIYVAPFLFGIGYIWKALVYNYVDYDDYKIFENRTIEAKNGQEWPKSTEELIITNELDELLTELGTIGFLALKNGEIVSEKYWDGYNVNTKANSFSVAKSYIGALTGIALQEGAIKSLDDPITNYLPNLEGEHFKKITIKHLLTMTSGLEWIESYGGPINHTTESYYGSDLWGLVSTLKPKKEPGTTWHYKGSDPQLLSFIIKEATGKTVSEYLTEKIWQPTESNADALWSLDSKNGDEKAYCCINTNARNFARFGQLFLNHGKWNGQPVIDSQYVWQSLQPIKTPNGEGEPTLVYGYQWWTMADLGKNVQYCRGLNGQYIFIFPEKNMVVVRIGNERKKGTGNHPIEVLKIVEWVEGL
ncbi:MAG: serine hydrolase [Bacteroidetes bacterium]|nr:serine hydrolase [Bacteroidota bacterium]